MALKKPSTRGLVPAALLAEAQALADRERTPVLVWLAEDGAYEYLPLYLDNGYRSGRKVLICEPGILEVKDGVTGTGGGNAGGTGQ